MLFSVLPAYPRLPDTKRTQRDGEEKLTGLVACPFFFQSDPPLLPFLCFPSPSSSSFLLAFTLPLSLCPSLSHSITLSFSRAWLKCANALLCFPLRLAEFDCNPIHYSYSVIKLNGTVPRLHCSSCSFFSEILQANLGLNRSLPLPISLSEEPFY